MDSTQLDCGDITGEPSKNYEQSELMEFTEQQSLALATDRQVAEPITFRLNQKKGSDTGEVNPMIIRRSNDPHLGSIHMNFSGSESERDDSLGKVPIQTSGQKSLR